MSVAGGALRACLLAAGLVCGCASLHERAVPVSSGTQFGVTGNAESLYVDMQGILWRLPPRGGTAVALSAARDDLRHVQISPDGAWLAAQSFATGAWDIVVMRTDGSGRRNLTANAADDREPAWSADGRRLLFTSDRGGNEDIWSIDVASGETLQLTTDAADDYAPVVVGDAAWFVSDRDGTPGLYRTGPGTSVSRVGAAGDLPVRAASASPDGRTVAVIRTVRQNSFPGVAVHELIVFDVETGTTRTLSEPGSDVFPLPPAWPDDTTLLATIDGRIQRIDVRTRARGGVPFTARLPLESSHFEPVVPIAFTPDTRPVRGIVDPVMLPDDAIAFTALGDLWRLGADGTPERLTADASVERDLTVAPDGSRLAYISDRGGDMQVWLQDLRTGARQQVTGRARGPRYPTFSPDGSRLAYLEVGPRGTQDFTLRLLTLATTQAGAGGSPRPTRLRSSPKLWPGRMSFSADGTHLTVAELHRTSGRLTDGRNRLVRINLVSDTAEVMPLPDNVTPDFGPVASPDGRTLALVIDGALWRVPVAADGRLEGRPVRILDALVESPAFSRNGRRIAILTNRGLEVVDLESGRRTERNPALDWRPATGPDRQLIHAGRLWNGVDDAYRTDIDILIEEARIVAVSPHATHPADTPVIDAGDKTVLPGLIDHHVHFQGHQGTWVERALLAFGITTVVEPGGLPYESRERLESWLSGRRPGPRLVFSGPQLDGARRTFYFAAHINSEQRLEREVRRGERLGYGLLKTYRRLRPELQARAVRLGHEHGWPVTAHAAFRNLGFGGDRTEHLRGSSRLEYSPKQSDLLATYADVLAIFSLPGVSVTPTLVNQGGFFDFALRNPGYAELPQYQSLYTREYREGLAGFTRVVGKNIELLRAGLDNADATLATLDSRGVNIVAGTDSPIFPYGLALIIELQNYVDAGLTPAAALRTATSNAARALGATNEVGRIEAGWLADLAIVDGDPLAHVTDLLTLDGVMLNGRYLPLSALLANPSR